MKEDTKGKLAGIFQQHEDRKRQVEAAVEAKKTKEEAFVEEFTKLREDVVLPTFSSFETELKARGFHAEIDTEEDRYHATNKTYLPATATLTIYKGSRAGRKQDHPSFSVILERGTGNVRFHKSTMSPGTGGMSGGDGEVSMEGVTTDLLEQKIVSLIEAIFVGSRF